MAEHAEVFISGTTRDLGSYRKEIQNALLTRRIFPIEEQSFTLAYGPLTAMLDQLIGRCDAVIHLVAFSFGAEPSECPPAQPRGSYTQREYDVARKLGNLFTCFLQRRAVRLMNGPRKAKKKKRCSVRTGTLLSSVATFIINLPIARSSEVESRNYSSLPAVHGRHAEWLTFLTTLSARCLKVATPH
jgi:hypothetical protein